MTSESGTGTSLSYAYDADGNQTKVTGTIGGSGVNKSYTYTPENMLETYTEGSKSQSNLYSGDGQRVQKKEGSETTNYFYQLGSVLYTDDGSGNLKSFNLLNGSDAFGTERKAGSSHDYYLYTEDAKGSTVNVLDNAGSRVVSYLYDDFGDVTESKATGYSGFENELQYTGAVHDELTGLLYLNARYYEPRTGRFITRDSYRGERENADTWHLYAYCANNPINYVDPSRHYAQAVYMGYKTYRVAKSVAAVGAFITSPAGTLLVITAVLGVVVYHGDKYYKAKAEKAKSKGKAKKQFSKSKASSKASKNTAQKAQEIEFIRRKIPNDLLKPDGRVDLSKFKTRLTGNQGYKGPKDWRIKKDFDGHGGFAWKLFKALERIASIRNNGSIRGK